jgi:hypothetical protein
MSGAEGQMAAAHVALQHDPCEVVFSGERNRMPRRKNDVSGLALAPMVIWARMPILWYEALNPDPSRRNETNRMVVEKIAAAQEGMVAANLAVAQATFEAGFALMAGSSPARETRKAAERIMQAGLAPAARRVRANARRLSGG